MTGTQQIDLAADPEHELLVIRLLTGRRQPAELLSLTVQPVDRAGTVHNRLPPGHHARDSQPVLWSAVWAAAATPGCCVTRLRQPWLLPLRKLARLAVAPTPLTQPFHCSRRSCRQWARIGPIP
jgi:hypothetical protein